VAHKAWSAVDTLRDAVSALAGLGKGVATGLIWTGVIGLPVAVVLALVYLMGLVARRRWVAARRAP
jgi:tetrahydromethanopterin S-methyltransferase subunit F